MKPGQKTNQEVRILNFWGDDFLCYSYIRFFIKVLFFIRNEYFILDAYILKNHFTNLIKITILRSPSLKEYGLV